jgi:hypothetical protein
VSSVSSVEDEAIRMLGVLEAARQLNAVGSRLALKFGGRDSIEVEAN